MSSRDVLYRTVLRGAQPESPQVTSTDLSPMSNLAFTLHHGASLSQTPRRKLSLSSTLSDTPQSCHEASLVCSSFLHESFSSEAGQDDSPVSPSRRLLSRNKENFPSPYYSPSHSAVIPARTRVSPLKDVQNTVNRNLNFSPLSKLVSPSKRVFNSPHKPSPPEDFDTNSQDSGYSESGKKLEDDCFSVPVSCAPRKLNLDLSPAKPQPMVSPVKPLSTLTTIFSSTTSTPVSSTSDSSSEDRRRPFRKFSSLSKGDEEDALLMDLMDEVPNQLEQQPSGFSSLLSAPIQPPAASRTTTTTTTLSTNTTTTFNARPSIRRCLSMLDTTPTSSRVHSIKPSLESLSFKRPQPPTDLSSQVDCKRRRQEDAGASPLTSNAPTTVVTATSSENLRSPLALRQNSAPEASTTHTVKPKLQRSHSESHVSIMKALNKCSNHHGQLTGDFSKPIALPTIEGGKHPDLNAISVDTMADIVRGKFKNSIASFKILDCRYPYEYEGGHIQGAEMWNHPQMVLDHLELQKGSPVIPSEEAPRHILIFHCEFSAERGPKAQRLLREFDRKRNKEHYPALHFPETYLLEGGYKAFFESHPELCTPHEYVRMLDANFAEDLKLHRSKSKSWAAENKQSKSRSTLPRTGLKRLGL
ncbi:M-phase inducer phosphatase-like isoform X2 [Penaeus japonicus]|nr:M-phase inducer phosphatase-like isoform X2 [Penaeus japonicus]